MLNLKQDLFRLQSTYLNSAYIGPTAEPVRQAVEDILRVGQDPSLLKGAWELDDDVRERLAKLLGVPALQVALTGSVSDAVSLVTNGLNLTASDEVLLMEGDYPSVILPWLVAQERVGFQVRRLPQEDFFSSARFAHRLSPKTRFVGCSHVMFNTGLELPIASLAKAAHSVGALFLADTSQSFGGQTLSAEILEHVDILVGVAYKWLLGPYGTAYAYFSQAALERIQRTHASWLGQPGAKSRHNLLNYTTVPPVGAKRFDRGETANFLANTALKAALDLLLETGLDQIEKHNRDLVRQFLMELPAKITLVSSKEEPTAIVCLRPTDPLATQKRLAEKNVIVSVREGSLRASFHLFNTIQDVETLLREI